MSGTIRKKKTPKEPMVTAAVARERAVASAANAVQAVRRAHDLELEYERREQKGQNDRWRSVCERIGQRAKAAEELSSRLSRRIASAPVLPRGQARHLVQTLQHALSFVAEKADDGHGGFTLAVPIPVGAAALVLSFLDAVASEGQSGDSGDMQAGAGEAILH